MAQPDEAGVVGTRGEGRIGDKRGGQKIAPEQGFLGRASVAVGIVQRRQRPAVFLQRPGVEGTAAQEASEGDANEHTHEPAFHHVGVP